MSSQQSEASLCAPPRSVGAADLYGLGHHLEFGQSHREREGGRLQYLTAEAAAAVIQSFFERVCSITLTMYQTGGDVTATSPQMPAHSIRIAEIVLLPTDEHRDIVKQTRYNCCACHSTLNTTSGQISRELKDIQDL